MSEPRAPSMHLQGEKFWMLGKTERAVHYWPACRMGNTFPYNMTTDVADVTCKRCKRTHLYRKIVAERGTGDE